ncbi:MAG: hypothetical protein O0W85_09360, partial [Methanocorpusculum sp.]|nr:hypothetical protein [Methanocorpusculum sp.]
TWSITLTTDTPAISIVLQVMYIRTEFPALHPAARPLHTKLNRFLHTPSQPAATKERKYKH